MEMFKTVVKLGAIGLLLSSFGCDSGSSGSDDPNDGQGNDSDNPNNTDNDEDDWLKREASPTSEFKPSNIEGTIDEMVDALNGVEPNPDLKFAFIPKDLGTYFEVSVLGANRAIAELGVVGTVVAPNPDDDPDAPTANELQIGIFDEQIAAGATSFGVAPHSSELLDSIDSAVDEGATVITFDSDVAESKRQLYIGTINAEAGKTAGHTLADLIGDDTGTVVILGYDSEAWMGGYNRTHEARKVLEEAGHTVIVRHTNWSDAGENETFIQEALEEAENPVGCLGVFSNSFLCASAAEAAGVDIKVAAFDFEPETLEYMAAGKIHATHGQRIYYMGYLIPYLLYSVDSLGLDETKSMVSDLMVDDYQIDLGLDVIPHDGVDDYNAFLEGLGVL